MHKIDTMDFAFSSNGSMDYAFSSYFVHRESTFTKKLDPVIKDNAILLLFGQVTDEQRRCIHSFMDELFANNHCMALYLSDAERSKDQVDFSPFHKLCRDLRLDPGRREVIVNNDCKILYSDDYYSRPELLSE